MSSTATQFNRHKAREFKHLKCNNIAQPPRNKLAYKTTLTVIKYICNRRGICCGKRRQCDGSGCTRRVVTGMLMSTDAEVQNSPLSR